ASPHQALDSLFWIEANRQAMERMTSNFALFAIEDQARKPAFAAYGRDFESPLNNRQEIVHWVAPENLGVRAYSAALCVVPQRGRPLRPLENRCGCACRRRKACSRNRRNGRARS